MADTEVGATLTVHRSKGPRGLWSFHFLFRASCVDSSAVHEMAAWWVQTADDTFALEHAPPAP